MGVITLLSDMGTSDHYVAAIKGAILSQWNEAVIVDISHQIAPFNNMHAAFVLRNAWHEFPTGAVHIIGVNPEADGQTPHVVVRHKGHYFIGADSGIFSLIFDGPVEEAFELTVKPDGDHFTFPVKTLFVKAACHLARGGTVELLGRKLPALREMVTAKPVISMDSVKGHVIHIDRYGNIVTNITRDHFNSFVKHKPFTLSFGRTRYDIKALHKTYADVPPGDQVAFFGDSGFLEVAVNKGVEGHGGGAARLFGVEVNDAVRLELDPVASRSLSNA